MKRRFMALQHCSTAAQNHGSRAVASELFARSQFQTDSRHIRSDRQKLSDLVRDKQRELENAGHR